MRIFGFTDGFFCLDCAFFRDSDTIVLVLIHSDLSVIIHGMLSRSSWLFKLLIGADDALHQFVPHDILMCQEDDLDSLYPVEYLMACTRPLAFSRGRSICVISPVTTTREPSPMRVKNIFICSVEQFCASSSMI